MADTEPVDWRIQLSGDACPLSAELKDSTGLPWGCVVRPFASPREGTQLPVVSEKEVERCGNCYAYPNHLCTFEYRRWRCAICGNRNRMPARYTRQGDRARLPEFAGECYELDMKPTADDEVSFGERPAYIVIVDGSGDGDFMELVRSALSAAVSALEPTDLFALVTVTEDIGLYDLRAAVPAVRQVAVPSSGGLSLPLEELLPLGEALVQVGRYAEEIKAAIDSLLAPEEMAAMEAAAGEAAAEHADDEAGEARVKEMPAEVTAKRRVGFGAAVSAVVDLLSTAPSGASYAPRILSFLSGLPNHGAGSLRPRTSNGADGRRQKSTPSLKPATPFYRNLGRLCAERGICADLYIISHKGTGLGSLRPLCTLSGGVLHLYEPVAKEGWASVPQDVFNALTRKRAMQGMLRLRTSEEFRTSVIFYRLLPFFDLSWPIFYRYWLHPVHFGLILACFYASARAFGHLTPDSQYDNLYHVTACDEGSSFAFDLDFADASTFSSEEGGGKGSDDDDRGSTSGILTPRIQMAFCYCARLQSSKQPTAAGGASEWRAGPLVKRLRVQTVEFDVAKTPAEMYAGVVPEVVLKLLVHKVAIAMEQEGIEAGGEALLKQWVSRLCSSYRKHCQGDKYSAEELLSSKVAPKIGEIVRYVYGLIKSPMVRAQDTSMDWRVYKQTLWSRLTPMDLVNAVYPRLYPFVTAGAQARSPVALSMQSVKDHGGHHAGAAVTATGEEACAYFVLDAHSDIVVYTPIPAAYPTPDGAWPPPRYVPPPPVASPGGLLRVLRLNATLRSGAAAADGVGVCARVTGRACYVSS